MRILSLTILFSALSLTIFAQTKKVKAKQMCSEIINSISEQWKQDSTGTNKFRYKKAYALRNCIIDKIDAETVIAKLGKPNLVREGERLVNYYYYTFSSTINTGKKYYEAVVFTFSRKELLLVEIGYTDNDPS